MLDAAKMGIVSSDDSACFAAFSIDSLNDRAELFWGTGLNPETFFGTQSILGIMSEVLSPEGSILMEYRHIRQQPLAAVTTCHARARRLRQIKEL